MNSKALLIGMIFCLAGSAPAAGMKLADVSGSLPAFTGSQLFENGLAGFTVSANVDYAVFAPGAFDTAFPGEDPSGGADYVYAYQIENMGSGVTLLSVGLSGDEILGTVGFVEDPAFVSPSTSRFVGTGPTSVSWNFDQGELTSGLSSAVLLFTSANPPETDTASVLGAFGDTQSLPSPLPEPSTAGLLGLGALALIRRRGERNPNDGVRRGVGGCL